MPAEDKKWPTCRYPTNQSTDALTDDLPFHGGDFEVELVQRGTRELHDDVGVGVRDGAAEEGEGTVITEVEVLRVACLPQVRFRGHSRLDGWSGGAQRNVKTFEDDAANI